MNRAALVDHARESIARGSRSFAAASHLFDRETRERAWLLYAWCRVCDDIADGQDHGGAMTETVDPLVRLDDIEQRTERALAGEAEDDPGFAALTQVMGEVALPYRYVEDLITGFALDAEGWRPETQNDLLAYCYHVAGAVGCMMAIVMGVAPDDEETLDRACDLGIAFQLANIARDIGEDAAGGRCYLPRLWLAEQSIDPDDLMAPRSRPALALLAGRLADQASRYEKSARAGTPALSFRSAWAVLAAAGIYGDIARKVKAAGESALTSRQFTSSAEKYGWLARAAWQAARRETFRAAQRDPGLWSRPR